MGEWSKYSCGASVVVQQAPEALLALNSRFDPCLEFTLCREQQNVSFSLVIPFTVIMCQELRQPSPE